MKVLGLLLSLFILTTPFQSEAQNFSKIDSIINAEISQKNIAGGVAYVRAIRRF